MNVELVTPPAGAAGRLAVGVAPVLVGLLLYRLAFAVVGGETAPEERAPAATEGVVAVEFSRPEADLRAVEVAWREGLTVELATRAAAETTWRGDAEMAFLDSIDGVANQRADGLNWQFEVNGDYADRGAGAYDLEPGDRVLWKLAPYE